VLNNFVKYNFFHNLLPIVAFDF